LHLTGEFGDPALGVLGRAGLGNFADPAHLAVQRLKPVWRC
jgi:hypothetical protein